MSRQGGSSISSEYGDSVSAEKKTEGEDVGVEEEGEEAIPVECRREAKILATWTLSS